MLTRRRLFSAVAALGAFLIAPLRAKATEASEWARDFKIPENLKLPQQGEQLVFIPIPPDEQNLISYLETFMQRFTQRMDLTEGCELSIRFHDQDDVGFGIAEGHRDIRYRCIGDNLKFGTVFLLAVQATEDLMSRKDGRIQITGPTRDITAPGRFRAQVVSVSVMVRTFKPKPGPANWPGLFRTIRLRKK